MQRTGKKSAAPERAAIYAYVYVHTYSDICIFVYII